MNAESNVIEKSTDLHASVSRVWRALTDHREFSEWFGVKLDGPFVAGGISTGHITHPGYEHLKWEATVQRIEPEALFSFFWHPYAVETNVDYSLETPTLVTFRLEPNGDGCRLSVTESGFAQIPQHRRAEAFRMNAEGWAAQMENIVEYLEAKP